MTDLDPAAARANETGWSKDALKAEAERKKAEKKAAGKARWVARGKALLGAAFAVWDFFLRNLMLWVSIAGCLAIGAWEWINTSRGWHVLYPGILPVFTYVGAIGAVVAYFAAFWRFREAARSNDHKAKVIWLSVTIAAYLVCVAGVFIATATASQVAERAAKESRNEYIGLQIQRRDLVAAVELNDPQVMQLALDADNRTLKSLVDTAKGTYSMPDLDDGSGCPAPPKKFTMERLCAQANGGIDPFDGSVLSGLREEIKRDQLALDRANERVSQLTALDEKIRTFHVQEGDETAEALGQMLEVRGGTVLSWLLLVLSSLFLYCGGWGADWVLETIEAKRKAAKDRRTQPAKV